MGCHQLKQNAERDKTIRDGNSVSPPGNANICFIDHPFIFSNAAANSPKMSSKILFGLLQSNFHVVSVCVCVCSSSRHKRWHQTSVWDVIPESGEIIFVSLKMMQKKKPNSKTKQVPGDSFTVSYLCVNKETHQLNVLKHYFWCHWCQICASCFMLACKLFCSLTDKYSL